MLSSVQFKRQKHRVCFLAVSVKFFAINNVQVLALPASDNRNSIRIFILLQPLPHLTLATCAVRAVFAPALFASLGYVAEVSVERQTVFRFSHSSASLIPFRICISFCCSTFYPRTRCNRAFLRSLRQCSLSFFCRIRRRSFFRCAALCHTR